MQKPTHRHAFNMGLEGHTVCALKLHSVRGRSSKNTQVQGCEQDTPRKRNIDLTHKVQSDLLRNA